MDIGSDRLLENACGSSDVVVVNSFLLSTDGVDTNAFDKFTNSILEVLDSEEGSGKDLSVKHRFFKINYLY